MPKKLSDDFRGTAAEITQLAKKLIEGWHYQPNKSDRHKNHEKAFDLLLQEISQEPDAEYWSLQRIHNETGIDKSTISNMRIALIILGLLPYDNDTHSTQHIRDVWAAFTAPENSHKSYTEITDEKNQNIEADGDKWNITSVLYYARIGRFAGQVPSRDIHQQRDRPSSTIAPVKVAFLADVEAVQPELSADEYAKIAAVYPTIESMLSESTDDEGYYQNRTIKHIATTLGISPAIVKEVRIGLVAMGKLPEREPIDRERLEAVWAILENDKTTTIDELMEQHNQSLPPEKRWNKLGFNRAGVIGRIAGEVTPRVKRNKKNMLPKVLELMSGKGILATDAARELGLNEATVRGWTNEVEGFSQQDQIQASITKMLALIIDDPTINNVDLGKELRVSPSAVGKYVKRLIVQLKASPDHEDKRKLRIVLARAARPPSHSREYPKRKLTQGDG